MTDQVVTLRLTANASGVVTGVTLAKKELSGIGVESERSGRRAASALSASEKGARDFAGVLSDARKQVIGFFGAFVGFQGARALAHMADEYSNIRGQLQLATRSQSEFVRGEAEVYAISQRTSTALSSTTELYTRLARSTSEYGIGQERILGLTETINQTFTVSATAASAQANAITQLTQAFAGGVLRAEEFNSIIENSPRLAQALADGMGIGIGQLRKYVNDGKVSVKDMVAALESQAKKVKEEFEKMPLTIERAWTRITNAVLRYVGQRDQTSETSKSIAEGLAWIASNIDRVASGAITLGKVLLTIYSAKLLSSAAAYTFELVRQATLQAAATSAAREMGIRTRSSIVESVKSVGLVNAALRTLAAWFVGWEIGSYLREQFVEVRVFGIALVEGLLVAWENLKRGALIAWAAMKAGFLDFVRSALSAADGLLRVLGYIAQGQGNFALADLMEQFRAKIRAVAPDAADLAAEIHGINSAADAQIATIRSTTGEMAAYELATDKASQAAKNAAAAAGEAGDDTEDFGGDLSDAAKEAADFVRSLEAQVATYGLTGAAALQYEANTKSLTASQREQANTLIATIAEWDKLAAVNDESAQALDTLKGMQENLGDEVADLRAKLGGASAAQIAFNKTQRDAARAYAIAAAAADPSALDAYVKAIAAAREKLDLTEELEATADASAQLEQILSQFGDLDPFEKLVASIDLVDTALDKATDPKKIARMQRALGELNKQMEQRNLALVQQGVSSLQTYAKEGTAAYTALGIAQDVLAYKSAIAAIANQGSGDPYTAFARIAAMIALMASIGLRVGGSGGGFTDTAAQRQATQGTGSVLGDSTADSESIAHGVQITADATSELVGINRGMLNALNTLVARLGSASNMLARGAGEVDFGTFDPGFMLNARNGAAMGAVIGSIIPVVGTLVGAVLGGVLGSILGGSSRLTDQGIAIGGGSINDASFSAYQEHQVRSWRFGSRRTVEQTAALPDDVANQFQLVMDSIVDTVREGALALGLVPDEIEAAIAAYQLEATRISLKGLSAEEQQKELQAVFSQIFDGLAGQVVPFIGQFQRVGEGLGETLVRVATEVQVMQQAVRYLGIAIDETDPERFAQISDDLIQRAGGLEAFITQMTSFADKFAPESYKLEVASESLTAALAEVGLAVPDTEDGMWALMRSLDATTESGREQIATLLRLADTAGEYYSMLDSAVTKASDFLESLGLAERPLSAFAQELLSIRSSGEQAIESANILAQAHGREGASAIQLARIRQWTLDQEAAAIRRLQQQTQDLIAQLYGGLPGSLDAINARISELEGLSGGLVNGLGDIQDASASLFEAWAQGIQTVQDYLDSMLVGPLSALSPEEQLAVAQQQLIAMQQLAVGGDANALAQLPQLADTFLQLLQGSGASGADFETGFQWVRDLLQSVVDLPNPGTAAGPAPVELVPSAELIALYAARDAAEAAANAEQRAEWARQLTQNLADMATIMQVPVLQLIEAQGVNLTTLAEDLGVDFDNLGAQSVSALGFLASTLGVSMTDLTASLGLSLADLAPGLTELSASVGIDLAALTAGTTQTLAALAGSLGLNLDEISTALNVNLGALADSQSLISQALGAEISSLPEDQRAELEPLFDAIADATTEADANAAIAALEDAVNLIGGETANALAPYLDGVFPVSALDQLDYLGEIQDIAAQQLDVLGLINSNLRASNIGAGVPSYAVGTGYVPSTGLAMIHEGEGIIPAPFNAWLQTHGYPTGGDNTATLTELRALREEVAALRRENNAANDKIVGTVADGDQRARVQREDIDRRNQDVRRSRAG